MNRKVNAEFEFSIAKAELENLSSSMEFDMPDHPMTWDPDSIDPPDLPYPEGWENPGEVSAIYLVLDTSFVANPTGNVSTSKELDNEFEMLKTDAIREKVASISCAYDPVLFCDLLDDNIALSKLLAEVGRTTVKQQDPEFVMDIWDQCESVGAGSGYMDALPSASHAENPKGVDSELLQKIWRIDSDTAKRTINTTTQ